MSSSVGWLVDCREIPDPSASFRCPGCDFPMCGPDCAGVAGVAGVAGGARLHADSECGAFRRNGFRFRRFLRGDPGEGDSPAPEYAAVSTIRALMTRERDPGAWESLQCLRDHCQERLRFLQHFPDPKKMDAGFFSYMHFAQLVPSNYRVSPDAVRHHQTFLVDFLKKGLARDFGQLSDQEIHRRVSSPDGTFGNLTCKRDKFAKR